MFICWSVGVFTAEGCSRCVARLENDMQLREQFLLPGRAPCPRPSLWTGAGISVPPASGAASPSRRMSSQLRTPGHLLAGVAVSSGAAVAVSDLDARAARPPAREQGACLSPCDSSHGNRLGLWPVHVSVFQFSTTCPTHSNWGVDAGQSRTEI